MSFSIFSNMFLNLQIFCNRPFHLSEISSSNLVEVEQSTTQCSASVSLSHSYYQLKYNVDHDATQVVKYDECCAVIIISKFSV